VAYESSDPDALNKIAAEALTQLAEGEPGMGDAGAVLMLSESSKDAFEVRAVTASPPCKLVDGSLEPAFPEGAITLAEGAHSARATSGALTEVDGMGVATLRAPGTGKLFGVLVSGDANGRGGRVPDEFLTMMSSSLGRLLDRAWRKAKMLELVDVARQWIESVCEGRLEQTPLAFTSDAPPAEGGGAGVHELGIERRGSAGWWGTLHVVARAGPALNETMVDAIQLCGEVLQQAADELESMAHGDASPEWTPASLLELPGIDSGRIAAQLRLPLKILDHVQATMAKMSWKDLIGELKSYKSPPPVVVQVMRGVLTLLAKAKTCKELPEWKEVHAHIELPLVKAVREFDPTLKGGKTRWIETKKAIKDLTSDEVLKRGSAAVQVFQKWIEACRLVRSVCQQLRKDAAAAEGAVPAPEDAEEEEE